MAHKVFFIDRYVSYAKDIFESIQRNSDLNDDIKVDFIGPDKKNLHWIANQDIREARMVWSKKHYVFSIFKIVKREKPSIVNFSIQLKTFGSLKAILKLPILLLLLKVTKSKIIITLHDLVLQKNQGWNLLEDIPTKIPSFLLKLLIKKFFQILCALSNHVVVDNIHSREAVNQFLGVSEKKISVIYLGLTKNQTKISMNKINEFKKKFAKKKIILCFGIISPRKGHIPAVKAMKIIEKKFPDHILVISGKTNSEFRPYEKKLRELVTSLNLDEKIIFTGFLDDEEVNVLFSIANLIVYDYKPMNSISNALTFAITHGKATILSDIETFREIATKDQVIFVKPENEKELANAIMKIESNDGLKESLEQNIKRIGIEYNWDKVGIEYVDLYRRIINQK